MQIEIRSPGGPENLRPAAIGNLGTPGPGEPQVRIHASSLNYHDYLVVTRPNGATDGRSPLSDASCIVEAVAAVCPNSRRAIK